MGGAYRAPQAPDFLSSRPTCEILAKEVACPKCGAAKSHRCRRGSFPWRRLDKPHPERISRASLKYQP
ncbi:hypothetical protein [Methylobacterium sp. 285MFTsu5.1]|uniref:zinc finger domain-containing protein n=1 Tax=Methylobacterium sp. 285MFTsu5.1 TaxID=1172187 RepID=UPI001319CF28|nr:hypothetical protein [Methylobacterium sp. 285MFTsu5.1]